MFARYNRIVLALFVVSVVPSKAGQSKAEDTPYLQIQSPSLPHPYTRRWKHSPSIPKPLEPREVPHSRKGFNPKHFFTNLKPIQSIDDFRKESQLSELLQMFGSDRLTMNSFPFAFDTRQLALFENDTQNGGHDHEMTSKWKESISFQEAGQKPSTAFENGKPAKERSKVTTSIHIQGSVDPKLTSAIGSHLFFGGEQDSSSVTTHPESSFQNQRFNEPFPIGFKDMSSGNSKAESPTPFDSADFNPSNVPNLANSQVQTSNGNTQNSNPQFNFPQNDLENLLQTSVLLPPTEDFSQVQLSTDISTNSQLQLPPLSISTLAENEIDNPANFDPEFFLANKGFERYQPPVGGSCVTTFTDRGICVPLSECPTLRSAASQQQYTHVVRYLASNLCRYAEEQVYFCCSFYTFSGGLLTRTRSQLTEDDPKSPYPEKFPEPSECGEVKVAQARIIGGTPIKMGSFPWLAAVGTPRGEKDFIVTCSGSIITKRHVLSAAHCFYDPEDKNPTHVRLAEHNVYSNEGPEHQDFLIVARHDPKYFWSSKQNDLIVLTLDKEIIYNDYIQPVCLPFSLLTEPLDGRILHATGFGLIQENSTQTPHFAHTVQLQSRPLSRCQQGYTGQRGTPIAVVDHRSICAGGEDGTGICNGDSGGPLHVVDPLSGRHYQVGVMIASNGCGMKDFPSISTKVAPYLPWMRNLVRGL